MTAMANGERSISTVLNDIVGNLQTMIRSELRLAKTEAAEELGKARNAGILISAGAIMIVFSLLFALLAVVYALSTIMPGWSAALIVALVTGIVAAVCVSVGVRKFGRVRAAPNAAASMKENVEWAKQLTR
jgi:uncharacterized membrane protein YqjE